MGLVIGLVVREAQDFGAADALDQHLDGAVGQLQQLQHRGQRADIEEVFGRRLVLAGVLLGDKQDLLVGAHHLFERADRLLAADEKRHDHVRENDDVAQRQDGVNVAVARGDTDWDPAVQLSCHFPFLPAGPGEAAPVGRRQAHGAARLKRVNQRGVTPASNH